MLTKACGETIRLSACLSTEQVSMKQEAQKLQLWVAHFALPQIPMPWVKIRTKTLPDTVFWGHRTKKNSSANGIFHAACESPPSAHLQTDTLRGRKLDDLWCGKGMGHVHLPLTGLFYKTSRLIAIDRAACLVFWVRALRPRKPL